MMPKFKGKTKPKLHKRHSVKFCVSDIRQTSRIVQFPAHALA